MPAFSNSIGPKTETASPGETKPKVVDPLSRLKEIQEMSKMNLSKDEKKSLRKEVKGIKKEMKANSRGVYLSVGAIIIIVLLLILLL